MNTTISNPTNSPKLEKIEHWLEHVEAVEETFPQVFHQWEIEWSGIRFNADYVNRLQDEGYCAGVLDLHERHPEYVHHARAHWATMSLFDGRTWNKNPKIPRNWIRVGNLPPLLSETKEPPSGLAAKITNELNEWAAVDRTRDGGGLGIVGPYGSNKAQLAVFAIKEMFMRFPFRREDEKESLEEPTCRTASFFRAAEISSAFEEINKPEESYECAVASGVIEDCKNHEILLIANIGDIPMNTAATGEFLNLLEHRRIHRLPTVWTTQFTSGELEKRFSTRMASLIVQNLSKTITILKL